MSNYTRSLVVSQRKISARLGLVPRGCSGCDRRAECAGIPPREPVLCELSDADAGIVSQAARPGKHERCTEECSDFYWHGHVVWPQR